jgi:hypothetical protein
MCLRIDDYLARKQLPVIAHGAACLALADVICACRLRASIS